MTQPTTTSTPGTAAKAVHSPEAPLWTLRVPAAGMPFLTSNAARRNTWPVNARLTKAWRNATALRARGDADMPKLKSARILITVHHRDARRRDAANLAPTGKACIDGLIDAGLLPDDDDRHLTGPDYRTGAPVGVRGIPHVRIEVFARAESTARVRRQR